MVKTAMGGLVVSTPSDREIVMTRRFDASRELVFAAFTDPKLIQRWLLGPPGWSMPVCELDLRVGGTYHYEWRNDAGDKSFGVHGTFREIVRPVRIVHSENFDEPWYPGDATVTTAFDESQGTTLLTMTILYDSKEIRDGAIESGMTTGVEASFDRLAAIMAEGAS